MWRIHHRTLQKALPHFEELLADNLCRFTLEAVSQLDQDASIALAAIREWRNSFAHVNRISTDVLSLIPTHLPIQKDRFHAASVCRRWRGALLEHGALWSQLFLRKGEECVSTLLARAKGSVLDIVIHNDVPAGAMALISPRAQQIRRLEFVRNHWQDIVSFSKFNSGQLLLLRALKIIHPTIIDPHSQPDIATSPPLSIFGGSINLGQFIFHSQTLSYLSHFTFPNLTTFELMSRPRGKCSALHLLNFLKASPMLQTVKVEVSATVTLSSVPQEMVVVLPNVRTFSLHVADGPMTHLYDIAAHISRPCARHTSLINEVDNTVMSLDLKIFPTLASWNTIVHQHTTSPVEEVTLEIHDPDYFNIESFLTFQSFDTTVVRFGFDINETGIIRDEYMIHDQMGWEIFSQAFAAIQGHPRLLHLKRLRIDYRAAMSGFYPMSYVVDEVRDLFGLLGSLDELTIRGCDLHVFLSNFLDNPGIDGLEQPVVFPQTKELTILHPLMEEDEMECMNAIMELAESQHALRIPFERITVHARNLPAGMAEELGRWVGAVDCREEEYTGQ